MKKGHRLGDRTFKVHLHGHNLIPFLSGREQESPREGFLYWSDDGDLVAIRVKNWKVTFKQQNHIGFGVWQGDFTNLRTPDICNMKADPFERGPESLEYRKWQA